MIINGLDFRQTCECSPEQYDVFDSNGHQVGYVRLRWGGLTCEYPDVGGEEIYSASVGDDWNGCFENEDQRLYHLKMIANTILARINRERSGMSEDDRKEAIELIMKGLEEGELDLEAACSQIDRDEIAIIREAMELLIGLEGGGLNDCLLSGLR